jgi:hypothetical protein
LRALRFPCIALRETSSYSFSRKGHEDEGAEGAKLFLRMISFLLRALRFSYIALRETFVTLKPGEQSSLYIR